MKNLFSRVLLAALLLGLPSLSMAKGRRHHPITGEVTAVNDTTITIQEKGKGGPIKTLFVPAKTPINDKGGSVPSASASASSSTSSAASTSTSGSGGGVSTLSGLVGKHVRVRESSPGTASKITVIEHKGKKKA